MPAIEIAGPKNIENKESCCDFFPFDFENAEYQRDLIRPAEIKEDVHLMAQRQRVKKALHCAPFHHELNTILDNQFLEGATCGGEPGSSNESSSLNNRLLPQLSRLGCSVFSSGTTMPIIPINDVVSLDANIDKHEKLLRCKLAAVYRLIDVQGWAMGMMLHASARITRDSDLFIANCHGLLNHEVSANNLVTINANGEVQEGNGVIDLGSWVLHAAVHKSDPSMRCVVHIKTPSVIAVSSMRSGLLCVSEETARLGVVAMYEWGSSSTGCDGGARVAMEQGALAHVLAASRCVLISNQGMLVRGRTVEEAWMIVSMAVRACDIQVSLATMSTNITNTMNNAHNNESPWIMDDVEVELHFEGLMRALDASGHNTGYLYRHVIGMKDLRRCIHGVEEDKEEKMNEEEDVQIPPSVTSFYDRRAGYEMDRTKTTSPTQWYIHRPNDYVRQESEDGRGPRNCRKIVTWRQLSADERLTSGTMETNTSPNQFAPQGDNPNELKHQQQKVKAKYFCDETTAGHQSRILRSLDSPVSPVSVTLFDEDGHYASRPRAVLVGAVSRGIIDKNHREDRSVYETSYSPNPFNGVSDEDMHRYKRRVEPRSTQISSPSLHQVTDTDPRTDTLSPARTATMLSDTSYGDMSHDDTEREGYLSTSSIGTKKKKTTTRLRNMFSFRRKDKGK